METLQNRLKILRGSATQAEFAKRLGIPLNTLGRYERGVNNPDLDFLIAVHDKFGVSLDWLVFGVGDRRIPGCAADSPAGREAAPMPEDDKLLALYEKLVEAKEREISLLKEQNADLRSANAELRNRRPPAAPEALPKTA
jgi:transcriptional regulator with XRE-family HTH domain